MLKLCPWVVASVAAHGLVFASLGLFSSGNIEVQGGGNNVSLVTVELMADESESLPQVVENAGMQKADVKAKAAQSSKVVAQLTVPQAKDMSPMQNEHADSNTRPQNKLRPADTATKVSTQKSSEYFTSLIRQHLESFKYYPASARRRGIEGEVDVAFGLAMNGRAYQVAILRSSGYAVLDRAALETVQLAEPFPVNEGEYRFRLRFGRL